MSRIFPGTPKLDPKVLAIINSKPRPEWLDTFFYRHFSPNGPTSCGTIYISFDSIFRDVEVREDLDRWVEANKYPSNIEQTLIDIDVEAGDSSKWMFAMNAVKHSIIKINNSFLTELLHNKFSVEYDFASWMGMANEYIKALIRKHETIRFDKNDRKRKVYRMLIKHGNHHSVRAYYSQINKVTHRELGPIAFWRPKEALHMQLRLVSVNSREFNNPKCDIAPIVEVLYLDRNRTSRVSLKACLDTGTFQDVKGEEVTFSNNSAMIDRIKSTIGEIA